MSSEYKGKEPDDDVVATSLAKALVKSLGLGETPPAALVDAYLAVLRGGACAEVRQELEALASTLDPRLASGDPREDATPLVLRADVTPGRTLAYLRVMDDAEKKFESYVRELFVARALPWALDEQADYLVNLRLDEGEPEPQKLKALRTFARQRSMVLTGGPGTGKTYALRALLWVGCSAGAIAPEDFRLLAPTNRGAREMARTLQDTLADLRETPWELAAKSLLRRLPTPITIHRALLNRDDLAQAKCVVVDEASMVDLVLFSRLLESLDRTKASLLIVGDPDQLPSVDVGTVLADLCHPSVFFSAHSTIRLSGSKRNKNKIVIDLADAVRNGKPEALVESGRCRSLDLEAILQEVCAAEAPFARLRDMAKGAESGWQTSALSLVKKVRVLCSLKVGPLGATKLSNAIMRKLGMSSPDDDGCVIMVTQNDAALGVVNGEVGIVSGGRVVLEDAESGYRSLSLSELPDYELAYASTIHKAQGAEYESVVIVVAESSKESFLSCELLYTAITRTKGEFVIFADPDSIKKLKPVKRASGLEARLR